MRDHLYPIDRVLSGNQCKIRDRCPDGEREVFAAPRCHAHVLAQNRRPFFRRYWNEPYPSRASVRNECISVCSVDVVNLSEIVPNIDTTYRCPATVGITTAS